MMGKKCFIWLAAAFFGMVGVEVSQGETLQEAVQNMVQTAEQPYNPSPSGAYNKFQSN